MTHQQLQLGQRARFYDGSAGTITKVYNEFRLFRFLTDSGAHFTARSDELSAEEATPRRPRVAVRDRIVYRERRDAHRAIVEIVEDAPIYAPAPPKRARTTAIRQP